MVVNNDTVEVKKQVAEASYNRLRSFLECLEHQERITNKTFEKMIHELTNIKDSWID